MMHTDPPQHTRYRRLVQPGFKPSMVRQMEAGVTAKARALVQPMVLIRSSSLFSANITHWKASRAF